MKYTLQPGVALTVVCEEYLLIATRAARKKVPFARGLNQTGAYFWSLLEEGMSVEEIVKTAAQAYKTDEAQVRPVLLRFLDMLKDANYLLTEDET